MRVVAPGHGCEQVIRKLRDIVLFIREDERSAFPKWVFELESCTSELNLIFKTRSLAMGYTGKLKEDVPGLKSLRNAILRLAGLTSAGGFGFSPPAVCNTILAIVDDLDSYTQVL